MKRVLFVCESFKMGGIQSSMINLANALQAYCQVDLYVYYPCGPLKQRLHPNIRVLSPAWRVQALGMSFEEARESGRMATVIYRTLASVWARFVDNSLPLRRAFHSENRLTGYDLAIAFHQEQKRSYVVSGFARFVDEIVEARCKAAWLHCDPASNDLDMPFNLPIYRRMDKVLCVSRALRDGFSRMYPEMREKADYCYNVVDRESLIAMSSDKQAIPYPEHRLICFSASRLSEEKALVRGVKALSPVFHSHENLMWYIAGEGSDRVRIQNAIDEAQLSDRILLIGELSNPYPYMRNADLLLNLSYHEAAPMVFLEAHALGVPVFATRTSSADELLRDGETDFICENSEEGIREGLARLMDDPQRLSQARRQAEAAQWPYESSVEKLLSWAEGAREH